MRIRLQTDEIIIPDFQLLENYEIENFLLFYNSCYLRLHFQLSSQSNPKIFLEKQQQLEPRKDDFLWSLFESTVGKKETKTSFILFNSIGFNKENSIEFNSKQTDYIGYFCKSNKQILLFFYKRLFVQFFHSFVDKIFINTRFFEQKEAEIIENQTIYRLEGEECKISTFKGEEFLPLLGTQSYKLRQPHTKARENPLLSVNIKPHAKAKKQIFILKNNQIKTVKFKNLFFFKSRCFQKKSWILLEYFFHYNPKFIFWNQNQHFETWFFLLENLIFSSYSFFFYYFILNFQFQKFLKKPNSNCPKFISFFKDKQVFKNKLVVFFLNILFEEQKSMTNYFLFRKNSLNNCVNIFQQQFQKNLYFITTLKPNSTFYYFLTPRSKIITWLKKNFSACFNIKNINLLMILQFSQILESFKNLFLTCYFLSLDTLYSFCYYRNNNENLSLLNSEYKNEQIFIFYEGLILFLTTKKKNFNQFLFIVKKKHNNFGLQVNIDRIVHSCFSFLNQKPGIEVKGFYFVQKITLTILKEKKNSCVIKKGLNDLKLWNIKIKRKEKKIIYWKSYTFPAIHYLLVYLKKLKNIVNKSKVDSQETLIQKLKIQMNQWCYYYQMLGNLKTLQICDYLLSKWLWRWACRRHSNKSKYWIRNKYYSLTKVGNNLKWKFCLLNKTTHLFEYLPEHTKFTQFKYKKVNRLFSIYEENWKNWLMNF